MEGQNGNDIYISADLTSILATHVGHFLPFIKRMKIIHKSDQINFKSHLNQPDSFPVIVRSRVSRVIRPYLDVH